MGNRLLARAIFLVRSTELCHRTHLARHDGNQGPAIVPIQPTGLTGAGPHPARTRGGARGGQRLASIPGRDQHDE